jgi:magnesium transporter
MREDGQAEDAAPREGLRASWSSLSPEERSSTFRSLAGEEMQDLFVQLSSRDQAELLRALSAHERRLWVRLLPPDDVADLLLEIPPEEHGDYLAFLDEAMRGEVTALLTYAEDAAGGLMSPWFMRVRPEATIDEAIRYLNRQARLEDVEAGDYAYVLDPDQRLLGVVSLRRLIMLPGDARVRDVMEREVVSVREDANQEVVARLLTQHGLMAVPVVDADKRMKGIITADDIVEVMEEEATEDIQKLGGMEALDMPYLRASLSRMIQKRAGWLTALFLGEMLTATAMARYESEIARAVVLALFVPLIISSGGNSGSQAATLVIRAMALGEVRLRDFPRVARRELASGLALGAILGAIGMVRILLWQEVFGTYGEHAVLVAITVSLSLVGVVTWGTLMGSLLPFLLRRLGFDPASASAPFVATLVDVSGLVIYFTVAGVVLRGKLL